VSDARAVIGIDLGTTHSSLAWARVARGAEPLQLPIAQWLVGRRRGEQNLLPSVLYAPPSGELPPDIGDAGPWIVGEYARIRAQETTGRGVTSAKSWLCHPGVDRLAPILPWGTVDDGARRLSPVDASSRILEHLRDAFESSDTGVTLAQALVVLTVPASFDPMARELTVLAATRAGYGVRLLEEPQAAFYEYLGQHQAELDALLEQRGSLSVLVCDIGGGTTDLTLIDVSRHGAALALSRSAVGRHLLLGGDNIDLALARFAEQKLGQSLLQPERFGQLLLACRAAKEALLSESPPESFPIRLLGTGSALLGNTLAVDLRADEARALVLDGFFPESARHELPAARRSALTAFGLPYERDAAVTRHVAQFLARHLPERLPDAVLLNGGLFRSPLVRERLLATLQSWGSTEVRLLSQPDPELSVCRGAVRYGLALAGFGPRIAGGAAQGYYVAVDGAQRDAARQALCVVPRGAQEGERYVAGSRRFELVVGSPVRFELYASDTALHAPGALVELDVETFQPLPPVAATLPAERAGGPERLLVQLEGELSAVGTLELDLRVSPEQGTLASASPRRFSLAFDLRPREEAEPEPRAAVRAERRLSERKSSEEALVRVFGPGNKSVTPREVKDLLRTLERWLGPRKSWDLELSRGLFDVLLGEGSAGREARLRSADHERLFWMLAGHCLRPGFGHPLDRARSERLWPAFEPGVRHRELERNWQQFWIAWRRVAGGLGPSEQLRVRDVLDPVLAPPELKLKRSKSFRPLALPEIMALAASLERLEHTRRSELGRWLVDRTWSDRDPELWAHVGRIGARVPMYASVHYVLPANVVERWLSELLRERWDEVRTAAASAFSLARVTGDQVRDVSPALRAEVARALAKAGAPEEWRRAVSELVPVTHGERERLLGDDLPLGLILVDE
jgi:molecular chaperone DnaK (HSP70)